MKKAKNAVFGGGGDRRREYAVTVVLEPSLELDDAGIF